jgi:uncharacterized protein YbaP (TraB family)
MLLKMFSSRLPFVFILTLGYTGPKVEAGTACVWRVSDANGATLFLGGSMHALRSTDYPLPSAYNRAFDASTRLALEYDPKEIKNIFKDYFRAGQYPKGDTLKNHVDPRTYDYVRRFFALRKVPEAKFNTFRPWFIAIVLTAPSPQATALGVERFLIGRAQANSKPVSGLDSLREGVEHYSGLNERESEAFLLLQFVNAGRQNPSDISVLKMWRSGDVETLTRLGRESFRDFPTMDERLRGARNRKWIPKIEGYLRSGHTYFVVAGAAHMGGPDGLLALLQARGYKIEQL